MRGGAKGSTRHAKVPRKQRKSHSGRRPQSDAKVTKKTKKWQKNKGKITFRYFLDTFGSTPSLTFSLPFWLLSLTTHASLSEGVAIHPLN